MEWDEMKWDRLRWSDKRCDEVQWDQLKWEMREVERLFLRSTECFAAPYRHSLCAALQAIGVSTLKLPPPACQGTTCTLRDQLVLESEVSLTRRNDMGWRLCLARVPPPVNPHSKGRISLFQQAPKMVRNELPLVFQQGYTRNRPQNLWGTPTIGKNCHFGFGSV